MEPTLFTPRGFDTGCEAVVQAFLRYDGAPPPSSTVRLADKNAAAFADGSTNTTNTRFDKDHDDDLAYYPLTKWSIVRRDSHDGASVLIHRTIAVPWIEPESEDDQATEVGGGLSPPIGCEVVNDDSDTYIDESLLPDPSVTVLLPDDTSLTVTGSLTSYMLEWTVSVAYSHTFQVPVLYFTVARRPLRHRHHYPDGGCNGDTDAAVPLSRFEVLRWLELRQQQGLHHDKVFGNNDDDGLEMVSHDEHPVFGTPVLFLHPCRTAERLEALWEGQDGGGPGGGVVDLHKAGTHTNEGTKLLSWMSLVLPAVGFGIPARLYVSLRKTLLDSEEEGELAGPEPHVA